MIEKTENNESTKSVKPSSPGCQVHARKRSKLAEFFDHLLHLDEHETVELSKKASKHSASKSLSQLDQHQTVPQCQPASAKPPEESTTLSLGQKLLNFLHLKEKTGDLDVSISEEELSILRDRLPLIHNREDLSFKLKYHFCSSKIIGKGAFGVVRLASANNCGELVKKYAVKELRKKRKQESCVEYLMKLVNEFRIAIQMDHRNVVHTVDFVMIGDRWYEVMEYCAGGDLFAAIQRGQMTQDEIDCCFRQMVEGVRYLHNRGVSHRDLKPENMLIDAAGNIKITDFGVSETFYDSDPVEPLKAQEGPIHKLKGLCGSCPYIAPEEFTGAEYDGRLVDVWSLGIIYYVMVFHGVPWEMAHPKNELFKHFLEVGFDGFESFNRLPTRARHILRRILEPDPAKRATIEEIWSDEWFQRIRTCNNSDTSAPVSEKTFSYNCDSDHDDHPRPIHHHCLENKKE